MKKDFNNLSIEEKIYSFEEDNTIIGIGSCEPFENIRKILETTETPFVEQNIEKRINPKLTRPTAKSIIAMGLSYNKKFRGKLDKKIRGKISIGAMGIDYHILLKEKLENIKNMLSLEGDIFVDTGPLVDREVAIRCGLGLTGKSGNLISEKLGSIFFIGYFLTDTNLTPSKINYKKDICGDCQKCVDGCPTGAILENKLDYKVCISYLTQCKDLKTEEREMIGRQIYGCDICQIVCPYNRQTFFEEITDIDTYFPDLEKLLFISNSDFKETYKKTAGGWRGKKILQRNAIISIANGKYSAEAINLLHSLLKMEKRQDIIDYCIWAIEKLEKKKLLQR